MRATIGSAALWISIAAGCGGSAQQAESPDTETETEMGSDRDHQDPAADESDASDTSGDGEKKEQSAAAAEPAFTPDMSVEQAQAAVPVGTERQNIEQDALGRPLQEPGVFDSCKLGTAKFKVRVAVWNGKAVGIDIETTPKNPALAECLKARVRELSWPDKVRSLNTVEFQF